MALWPSPVTPLKAGVRTVKALHRIVFEQTTSSLSLDLNLASRLPLAGKPACRPPSSFLSELRVRAIQPQLPRFSPLFQRSGASIPVAPRRPYLQLVLTHVKLPIISKYASHVFHGSLISTASRLIGAIVNNETKKPTLTSERQRLPTNHCCI